MSSTSRRVFLARTAALLSASKLAFSDKLKKSNLGVQLYTVRNIIAGDPANILKQIHDIGYTEIEATMATLDQWDAIKNSGMKAVSVHMSASPTDEQLADVKQKGFEYAVIPSVPKEKRGSADQVKELAAAIQKIGERAKSQGLQLCYHNHAGEFTPLGGSTVLDTLMQNVDANLLKLEVDIFWVTVAGHDPVEILKRYSGRVPLLHLKDKEKGVPAQPQFNETVPKDTFKEIGNGSIDIPAVLKAANAAGAKHYFVEQDQSPDPIASLRQSYEYLRKQF